MAKFGSVDYKQLQEFSNAFAEAVGEVKYGQVLDDAMREVGRRHLRRLIKNTPHGHYPRKTVFVTRRGGDGAMFTYAIHPKRGGTLKKGWLGKRSLTGVPSRAEIDGKAATIKIVKKGKTRSMTFCNAVEYASWVEYGHRLCHPPGAQYGWIPARHFVHNSEAVTQAEIPDILERHMRKALKKRGKRWWK